MQSVSAKQLEGIKSTITAEYSIHIPAFANEQFPLIDKGRGCKCNPKEKKMEHTKPDHIANVWWKKVQN